MRRVDFIPMTEEEADWAKAADTEMLAWERADYLLDLCPYEDLHVEIPLFYALGLHWGEVMNGGHAQFLANLKTRNRPWVLSACVDAAQKMYPPTLAECFRTLLKWVEQNPEEHDELFGLEAGQIEVLDQLDDLVTAADVDSNQYLIGLVASSSDALESVFVQDVLNGRASDNSHLNAMRAIWLKRSGLLGILNDAEVDSLFDELKSRQPLNK